MSERKCVLSLTNHQVLTYGKDCYIYYIKRESGAIIIQCNKSENSMVVFKENDTNVYSDIMDNIEKKCTKQLNEDGSRWEGDWYNEQPFGFGSLYDSEGNRIYIGFMFEGKKVGFGTEYFADTHTVDYCGNFVNDVRHGRKS